MKVWVTRTEPGASALGRALQDSGFEALVAPVLTIEPLPRPHWQRGAPPPGGAVDYAACVLVSVHAVRCGLADTAVRAAVAGAGVRVALGPATAQALTEAGLSALVPPASTSEGVLETDALRQLAAPARVLLVAGCGGRTLLADSLPRRGITVDQVAVYRRVASQPPADALAPQSVGAIVAASGDGVTRVAEVWFARRGAASVALLVPSARVAHAARAAGFTNVHVADGAGTDAVLACLTNLVPGSPGGQSADP